MVSFYIISERFSLKIKGLSDARVASIFKKENASAVHFLCVYSQSLKIQYLMNHEMLFVDVPLCL